MRWRTTRVALLRFFVCHVLRLERRLKGCLFLERGQVCHTPTSLPSVSGNVLISKRADILLKEVFNLSYSLCLQPVYHCVLIKCTTHFKGFLFILWGTIIIFSLFCCCTAEHYEHRWRVLHVHFSPSLRSYIFICFYFSTSASYFWKLGTCETVLPLYPDCFSVCVSAVTVCACCCCPGWFSTVQSEAICTSIHSYKNAG